MPKTRRLTSLATLLHESLHESFGIGLEDGVDLVQERIDRRGTRLNLPRGLGDVVFGGGTSTTK